MHPLPKAREVLQFYREFTSTAPDELAVDSGFLTSPDGHPVVGLVVCYTGPLDKGEEIIRPLREFGPPLTDMVSPMPYTVVQSQGDPLYPHGRFNYWKSSFLQELSNEAIDAMIAHFSVVPSPFSAAFLEELGGAMSRVGSDETAFGDRSADYALIITSQWTDPAESDKNIQWAWTFWDAMQPFMCDSVYVNYLGAEGEERIKAAYGAPKYERLVALKNRYDPTNFFRLNQNIKPTAKASC